MTTSRSLPRKEPSRGAARLVGLDTLRFIAAAVVAMSHLGTPPITAGLQRTHPIAWFIGASYGCWCNGPAAVIVFFLISGLCIHYPHIDEAPSFPPYFIRRYIRVGIPLLASLGFCWLVGMPYETLTTSILWSLVCELIYYTIYPLLLGARRRIGWVPIIAAAFVAALVVVLAVNPTASLLHVFGWRLNWIVGLPAWLLGCLLAERVRERPAKVCPKIWYWRFAVVFAGAVALVLRFHSPIGDPWTLHPFAILVYFWLLEEIPHLRAVNVPRWTEWLGLSSYSLYLVHLIAGELVKKHYKLVLGPFLDWVVLMGAVLVISYLFYLVFEAPSHKLARAIASVMGRKRRAQLSTPAA